MITQCLLKILKRLCHATKHLELLHTTSRHTDHTIRINTLRPRDRSLPSQPISTRKAQSGKKKAQTPLRNARISLKMCRPCLVMMQSCYFDYRINKPFACSRCLTCISCSVHVIRRITCAKDHRLFQEPSWLFLILITHKATRSENSTAWKLV